MPVEQQPSAAALIDLVFEKYDGPAQMDVARGARARAKRKSADLKSALTFVAGALLARDRHSVDAQRWTRYSPTPFKVTADL